MNDPMISTGWFKKIKKKKVSHECRMQHSNAIYGVFSIILITMKSGRQ